VKYLLDTNVVSEIAKPNGDSRVLAYINEIPLEDIFLSVISIGEIAKGIEKLPPGKKKEKLSVWLDTQIPAMFKDRIISLDFDCMTEWGKLRARAGRTLAIIDSLVAAAALTHRLTILTRNTRDFEDIPGLSLIDPWEE
jgi:predicted nucleic acid-binding protein